MRGELIIVGDEVLDGRVLDLNGRRLAFELASAGLRLSRITTVGDEAEVLARVLGHAARLADFVVVTGGLGPTDDDLTTAVAGRTFGRPLNLNQGIFDRIEAVCRERGREMGVLERLAWLPQGAEPLSPQSHICGFSLRVEDCLLFFLPGVPEEAADLMKKIVLPRLLEGFGRAPAFCQRIIKLFGLTESETAARLEGLTASFPGLELGSYPYSPEVHLSLTAQGEEKEALEDLLDRAEAWLRQRLGRHVFGRDGESLAGVLGRLLKAGGFSLATAESCTGGRVAQLITSCPGSSAYFIQGVVTYADRAKSELLGVEPDLIRTFGAVSPQVARAMAEGLKRRAGVDLAASITGIAGPDGGSPEKPVGTVFFGLAGNDRTILEHRRFPGDRKRVQAQAAHFALDLVRRHLLPAARRERP